MTTIPSQMSSLPETITVSASALTPHNKALYEAGKSLLVDSVGVGREFCKFMIGTCSGAIPVYLGLLKFLLPEHYALTRDQGIMLAAPAALFLIGSIVFVIGYFPRTGNLSLDLPDEIERERNRTIKRRGRFAALGFAIFAAGTSGAVFAAIWALGQSIPVSTSTG